MMGKKVGKACLKSIVLVPTKAEFDELPGYTPQPECTKNKPEEEIIVPAFCQIEPVLSKKNLQIPSTYIKSSGLYDPRTRLDYEPDSVDLSFLQSGCAGLSAVIFSRIVVALEKETARKGTEFNFKSLVMRVLNKEAEAGDSKEAKMGMVIKIYNYWRNRRRNMGMPLLREFWPKTYAGPFKNREESVGHGLRNRSVKLDEVQIFQIVKADLSSLKQIFLMMLQREQMQIKLLQAKTECFRKSCAKVITQIEKKCRKKMVKLELSDSSQEVSSARQKKRSSKQPKGKVLGAPTVRKQMPSRSKKLPIFQYATSSQLGDSP